MTSLRPAASAAPAGWLLGSGVDWWDLVRFGPPGFEAYVRIALAKPSDGPDDVDGPDRGTPVRSALAVLAGHTTTPTHAYAAIWEGWTGHGAIVDAPRVEVPHRAMLLFTGPVSLLGNAPALAWDEATQDSLQEPHLVWPEDHAWCLACEVDEEIEFTVGCTTEVARALSAALPGTARRVAYGERAPLYRGPPRT
ncbi:MAG: hypothetical protein JWR42_558 [Marmoricola sp.]|nr:hypothetical protein [Marmoricola sp.]